jgi:putative transposase
VPAPIPAAALYRGYRFPPEIINYAVWLYLRFSLSLRDVEELLADRGVAVTYETIGKWVRRFGPVFAQELRRRGRRPGDKLHVDEVALKINGRRYWLWRAVDQHGFVVDILVQSRRDQHAAEAFIRRPVGGWDDTPRVVVTDKLASYPPALRRVLPNSEYRRHKGLNNRAENSHLPTRQRERRMQRSSHLSRRSASWSPSAPFATTSARAGIASRQPPTVG